jgi:uncharacterized protein (DUF58 family)
VAQTRWRVSPAQVRAAVLGSAGTLVAVAWHRPDLLVLSMPLVVVAAWGASRRPNGTPRLEARLSTDVLREGDGIVVRVEGADLGGTRTVTLVVSTPRYIAPVTTAGVTCVELDPEAAEATIDGRLRSTRWGVRPAGSAVVVGSSDWGAYRWEPIGIRLPDLTSLPVPAVFDAKAQPPHPIGLVGLNRSVRTGEGSEFAGIRAFQPGDRIRRVHWPVSLRTRQLHVTSTYADHDSHVLLVVDATTDLGVSGGVDGAASSLDLTVRAAGAIAEHYLRMGERVGLRLIGARGISRVPTSAGRAHLRRVLHNLAGMRYGLPDHDPSLNRLGVPAGALVVFLSPLASRMALVQAITLARRGLSVVVVDTLPVALDGLFDDPYVEIAWRIRVLERESELHHITEAGVPVVRWRGPGSLDQVLRDVGRQAAAPRMAQR